MGHASDNTNQTRTSSIGRKSVLAGLIAAVAFALFGVGTASAGPYTAVFCSTDHGSPAGYTHSQGNSGVITQSDSCESGGGIGNTVKAGTSSARRVGASYQWRAPAGVSVEALRFSGNLQDQFAWSSRMRVYGPNAVEWRPTHLPTPGYRPYSFDNALTKGQSFLDLPNTGYNAFSISTSCATSDDSKRCSRSKVKAYGLVKDITVGLRDATAPKVELTSKRMFTEVNYGETGNVTVAVSDTGSGVASRSLRVNGQPLPQNMSGDRSYLSQCQTSRTDSSVAVTLAPCPGVVGPNNLYVHTNDDPFQVGANTVEACATDFSGNRSCATSEVVVKPLPVEIETPEQPVEDTVDVDIDGQVGGINNQNVSGVIEVLDADTSTWKQASTWRSDRSGSLSSRLDLEGVEPASIKSETVRKKVCRKVRRKAPKGKANRNGKRRSKFVKRCGKKRSTYTRQTYRVRARVTKAPRAYAGGVSKMDTVVLRIRK